MAELRPLQMTCATLALTSDTDGWNLDQPGEEPRVFQRSVTFETPFPAPPLVQVAVSGFDVDNASAARIRARVSDIHPGGFTLQLETWRDTRVYGVDVSWLAMG